MPLFPELSNQNWLLLAAAGGLAFSVWCAAGLLWFVRRDARNRKLDKRLGLLDTDPNQSHTRVLRLWREGEEITTVVPHARAISIWLMHLRRLPKDAGWKISIELIMVMIAGLALFTFVIVMLFTSSGIASCGAATLVSFGFWMYMKHCIASIRHRFDQQFEDALYLIARSLRAGQPLLGAFQLVSDEMDPPINGLFHDICQQQALGVSLENAIRQATEDSDSAELKLFGTAIVIQLKTGGNLADMMNRLASIIRERARLARRITVLTAQTQFSKRILLVLPVFVLIMITAMNKEYMDPMFTTSIGRWMIVGASISMLFGSWLMNKMSVLNV